MKTRVGTLWGWLSLAAVISINISISAAAVTHYVDLNSTNATPPYTDWSTAATNIQSAIDAATDGDLVLVTNGVYATGGRVVYGTLTNRVVINKAVTVQSVNGPAVTIINGYRVPSTSTAYINDVRCVYMTNNAVMNGFTITNGAALSTFTSGSTNYARSILSGGGVFCENTNSILTNCVLVGNLCVSTFSAAGGGAVCQGTLFNCILSNNMVAANVSSYGVPGGAAYLSVLNNCLIISNSASFGGGVAYSMLNYCSVLDNVASFFPDKTYGGGTYMCTANYCLIAGNFSCTAGGGDYQGVLSSCVLSNNTCMTPSISSIITGGGSYQSPVNVSYLPLLNNCLIISNYCYGNIGYGGGVYFYGPKINAINCTIIGNTANTQGGGVCNGYLLNSIVIHNNCPSNPNAFGTRLTNCWTSDPLFINLAGGDYHLSANSPCINAGNNAYISGTNDFDNNPRIAGGTVDIGCYEYQTPTSVLSYAWAQQYGLPTDGTADYADTDGTGMNNWQKWIAGLNPTNPASVLAMQTPAATNNSSGITVTWQSVNTRTYYLQRATDFTAQPVFTSIQSNLVGQAGTTSYTDTTATNGGPFFYRVGVQ